MPSTIGFQIGDALTSEVDLMLAEWKAASIAALEGLRQVDPAQYATRVAAINATTPSQYVRGRLKALALAHWRARESVLRQAQFQRDIETAEGGL